jgi:hypothetical protein
MYQPLAGGTRTLRWSTLATMRPATGRVVCPEGNGYGHTRTLHAGTLVARSVHGSPVDASGYVVSKNETFAVAAGDGIVDWRIDTVPMAWRPERMGAPASTLATADGAADVLGLVDAALEADRALAEADGAAAPPDEEESQATQAAPPKTKTVASKARRG